MDLEGLLVHKIGGDEALDAPSTPCRQAYLGRISRVLASSIDAFRRGCAVRSVANMAHGRFCAHVLAPLDRSLPLQPVVDSGLPQGTAGLQGHALRRDPVAARFS